MILKNIREYFKKKNEERLERRVDDMHREIDRYCLGHISEPVPDPKGGKYDFIYIGSDTNNCYDVLNLNTKSPDKEHILVVHPQKYKVFIEHLHERLDKYVKDNEIGLIISEGATQYFEIRSRIMQYHMYNPLTPSCVFPNLIPYAEPFGRPLLVMTRNAGGLDYIGIDNAKECRWLEAIMKHLKERAAANDEPEKFILLSRHWAEYDKILLGRYADEMIDMDKDNALKKDVLEGNFPKGRDIIRTDTFDPEEFKLLVSRCVEYNRANRKDHIKL